MKVLWYLIKRNAKLFFKDKGTFLTAMIAPLIMLLLYALFLGQIFTEAFKSALPAGVAVSDRLINGYIAGWELSSILTVCCVTVAFIANMQLVQDKVTGARTDLTIAPVKRSVLALGYYLSTALVTMIVCYAAMLIGFGYLLISGWYLSAGDVFLILLDVFLLSLFGTALSSIVCHFLKSQGGMTAVGTIVSSTYGFICGAYYPISQLAKGIQNVVSCLPGTYGTSLLRNHFLGSVLEKLGTDYHFPAEVIAEMKTSFDLNLFFFDVKVSEGAMYAVLCASVAVLIGVFVLFNVLKKRKRTGWVRKPQER